jgi:hypothetical protein
LPFMPHLSGSLRPVRLNIADEFSQVYKNAAILTDKIKILCNGSKTPQI